jgi:hypothetical protein
MVSRLHKNLDERLKELQGKRRILEEKDALRITTMSQMAVSGSESRARMTLDMSKKVDAAKERNHELLRDVGAACKSSREFVTRMEKARTACSINLSRSKEQYLKNIEVMLPGWREDLSNRRADTMVKLEKEKERVLRRRVSMQAEFAKEEAERTALELKRRELFQALALEQQEQLSEQGKNVLRREEAQRLDGQIMRQVEDAGQALATLLATQSQQNSPERAARPPQSPIKLNTGIQDDVVVHAPTSSSPMGAATSSPQAAQLVAKLASPMSSPLSSPAKKAQASPSRTPSSSGLSMGAAQELLGSGLPFLLQATTGAKVVGLYSAANKAQVPLTVGEAMGTIRSISKGASPTAAEVAAALLQLMTSVGADLLPADSLTNIMGLEDMNDMLMKRGRAFYGVWMIICGHMDAMVKNMSTATASSEATRVAGIFANVLTRGLPAGGTSQEHMKRKVNSLLVLSVLEGEDDEDDDNDEYEQEDDIDMNTALPMSAPALRAPQSKGPQHEEEEKEVSFPASPTGAEQPSMIAKNNNGNNASKANFSMTAGTINISELDDNDDMFEDDEDIAELPDMTDLAPSDGDD